VVELAPGHAAIVEAEQEQLAAVGFEIEPFGGTAYQVRAMPEMLGTADPGQTLVDILAEMVDGAVPLARETHEKIAITVCKRASIKGGQLLSVEGNAGAGTPVRADHRTAHLPTWPADDAAPECRSAGP
jgi:DNA mismatch repair protein MutL